MLPDFPKARRHMNDLWNRCMFAGLNGTDPVLNDMQVRVQKEGHAASYGGGEMEYKTCKVEFKFDARNAQGMTREEFLGIPFKMGAQMAEQQIRHVFVEVAKEPTPHSTSMSWPTGHFTPDVFLKAWESMEINFDDQGIPKWPTAVLSPEAMVEVEAKMPEWLADPECQQRWAELVERKRKEFHEREARRRLVE